jgi:hypothetical protein
MMTVKVFALLPLAAIAVWPRADAAPQAGHQVVLHLTSFTSQAVMVHVAASPGGVQLAADTSPHFDESRTVQTPVDVRISANAHSLRLTTEGNLAIHVQFTDGASAAERALSPWGRRMLFERLNGDFRPKAEMLPAEPARTRVQGTTSH